MTEEKKEEKKKPIKNIKAGCMQVAIWENANNEGQKFNSITLSKSYTKDEGKTWEKTDSMGFNDLPKAILCLQEAYRELALKEAKEKPEEK